MKRLIKDRNFLLYLFGRNSSVFGDVLLTTALALYVLYLTESPKMFGSILAAAYIPRLVLSTFAGALVDRLPKKVLLVGLDLMRGILLITLFLIGKMNLTAIYLIILIFAAADTFFIPASIAIIPKIMRKEDMSDANSIDETLANTVTVVSPILACLLYASGGILIVCLIDGITFIVSAISELFLIFDDTIKKVKRRLDHELLDGLRLVVKDIKLRSLVMNGALTHLFLFPFLEVGITSLLVITFKAPEIHYGVVRGVMSGSAILAGILALLVRNKSISRNINLGIIGMIISVAFFTVMALPPVQNLMQTTPLLPVAYLSLCSFLIVLSFGYYAVFFRTFYQSRVPQTHLGRFTSLFMICVALSRMIGMYLYGILFESFTLFWPLGFLGAGMILKLIVHLPFVHADRKENFAEQPSS